jgi:hypothetical protein
MTDSELRASLAEEPPTAAEEDAIKREVLYLHDSAQDPDEHVFTRTALAGPCFCAGRFTCTKHKILAEAS